MSKYNNRKINEFGFPGSDGFLGWVCGNTHDYNNTMTKVIDYKDPVKTDEPLFNMESSSFLLKKDSKLIEKPLFKIERYISNILNDLPFFSQYILTANNYDNILSIVGLSNNKKILINELNSFFDDLNLNDFLLSSEQLNYMPIYSEQLVKEYLRKPANIIAESFN